MSRAAQDSWLGTFNLKRFQWRSRWRGLTSRHTGAATTALHVKGSLKHVLDFEPLCPTVQGGQKQGEILSERSAAASLPQIVMKQMDK